MRSRNPLLWTQKILTHGVNLNFVTGIFKSFTFPKNAHSSDGFLIRMPHKYQTGLLTELTRVLPVDISPYLSSHCLDEQLISWVLLPFTNYQMGRRPPAGRFCLLRTTFTWTTWRLSSCLWMTCQGRIFAIGLFTTGHCASFCTRMTYTWDESKVMLWVNFSTNNTNLGRACIHWATSKPITCSFVLLFDCLS